jgi:hypothetical protein
MNQPIVWAQEISDVMAIIDASIAAEADPKAHPLYQMVCWHLERCLTPLAGGQFFDRCRQLVLDAIGICIDDALALEDKAHGEDLEPHYGANPLAVAGNHLRRR